MTKGHVANHACRGTRITLTNLEARGMHNSSEPWWLSSSSIPTEPFIHSLFINSCFTPVSQRGGTDSAEPMLDTGYKWVINCRCLYARVCSHCPSLFDSNWVSACVPVSVCECVTERAIARERERETGAKFLMTSSVFCICFFSLSSLPGLHENVYTRTLLHMLIVPGLAALGREYTIAFIKVWASLY